MRCYEGGDRRCSNSECISDESTASPHDRNGSQCAARGGRERSSSKPTGVDDSLEEFLGALRTRGAENLLGWTLLEDSAFV
jgi:hypothetical protein